MCRRLEKLQKAYYKKAAEEWDPKLKEVSKALEKWIPGGIQVNGSPSAIGVFDTISACVANGIELPPQFLDKNFQRVLHDAMIAQWYSVYVGIPLTNLFSDWRKRNGLSTRNSPPPRRRPRPLHIRVQTPPLPH